MDRYKNLGIVKDTKGIRTYVSTFMPEIPVTPNDVYVISDSDTRLESLAFEYYNDTTLWPIISRANLISNGSTIVPPGIQLRIPSITIVDKILMDISQFNKSKF